MRELKRSRRGRSRVLAALFLALGVTIAPLFFSVDANVVGADTSADGNGTSGFYLDLGGSASMGMQPTVSDPGGQPTDSGYANDLMTYEAARGATLQLTQLGCPGESTGSMINGGDRCYQRHDSQFADALKYLRLHHDVAGFVTIDIGFNNIRRCCYEQSVDETCVAQQIRGVRKQLPTILDGLKNVAGSRVTFVGLGHYDPFLADALRGPVGEAFAEESSDAINRLNVALNSIYTKADMSMATVGTAFESRDVERVMMSGVGMVADNVAHTCELTWMCEAKPYGPNVHPNDEGYATIATAIEGVLKAPW